MKYLLLYYLDEINDNLYVSLKDNDLYPAIYENNKWVFIGKSFKDIKKDYPLKQISYENALAYTFGLSCKELYQSKNIDVYNKVFKINKEYDKDFLKKFLNNYYNFALEDLTKHYHNKDNSLKYSARELDIHYENNGTYEFIDSNYLLFLKRKEKGEFPFVEIIKLSDDYIMIFKKKA